MYFMTRDDGVVLRVSGGTWEEALELASFYGWRPAGTESPRSSAAGPGGPDLRARWDRLDYFSSDSQRVGRGDARALAASVHRALASIPVRAGDVPGEESSTGTGSPLPSRRSAMAEGLSASRRQQLHRLAVFAESGGFSIDAPPA